MAIATVRTPQGVMKIRVPEGATPEEIQEFARAQIGGESESVAAPAPVAAEPTPERPEESWYEDLAEGVGSSAINTAYGLKSLFTDLDDKEKARIKDWEEDAGQSGWGTAGRVIGELGQLAIPGGVGLKAARALSKAGKAAKTAKALPLASDVAGTAAHSYVQPPRDDNISRESAALYGGAAALGGGALGRVLAPIARGVKGTPATERLRDAGAELTPGMMKPDSLGRLENYSEYLIPSWSKAVQKRKGEAAESVQKAVLREAAPPTAGTVLKKSVEKFKPTKPGWEGIEQLQDAYKAGYKKAWGGTDELTYPMLKGVDDTVSEALPKLGKKDTRVVNEVMADINKLIDTQKATPAKIDEVIRMARFNTPKRREVDNVLGRMRTSLRSGLPKENQTALKRMDAGWPKMLTVQKAAAPNKASMGRGALTPESVTGGSRRFSTDAQFAKGQGPLQTTAADWKETMGEPAGMLMTTARRFVQAFPSLVPGTKGMSNILAGNKKSQAELRKLLQTEMAEKLRYGVSSARLGGAYEDL